MFQKHWTKVLVQLLCVKKEDCDTNSETIKTKKSFLAR